MEPLFTVKRTDEHRNTAVFTLRRDGNYVEILSSDIIRILLRSETTVFQLLQHIGCVSRRNKMAVILFDWDKTVDRDVDGAVEDIDEILKLHPSAVHGVFTVTIQNKMSLPRATGDYMELFFHQGNNYIRNTRNHVWEWIPFKGPGGWCGVYDEDSDVILTQF